MKKNMVAWKSHSNIAFIKYWGKFSNQIPCNPSLSMGLSNCYSYVEIIYELKKNKNEFIEFYYDNKRDLLFEKRVRKFILSSNKYLNEIEKYKLVINTKNNFPHSIGIASSASSFSALALCLCDIEKKLIDKSKYENVYNKNFYQQASNLARLGSGSASRSLYGGLVLWGETDQYSNSSNEYSIQLENKTSSFISNIYDAVLIVDKSKKQLSSSHGHLLMKNNPFREIKYSQSRSNLKNILDSIYNDDFITFIEIIEKEALLLHSMVLTSNPYSILLKPNTIKIINAIINFRKKLNIECGFTLDAGATVHMIYKNTNKNEIENFINTELMNYCVQKPIINRLGYAPEKLY